MQLGLWLPVQAARLFARNKRWQDQMRDALEESSLEVRSINAFPFGNFHDAVVKQKVYQPDWTDPRRREHTVRVAKALAQIVPESGRGSISTVPLGVKEDFHTSEAVSVAGALLGKTAADLHRLEQESGRWIRLALEPEPDCALMLAEDVVEFFAGSGMQAAAAACAKRLGVSDGEAVVRRYIGVCLDTCHASVEFESPVDVLSRLEAAGIAVFKVQLSSAPVVRSAEGLKRLRGFSEDRYLHQTRASVIGAVRRWRDLPEALADLGDGGGGAEVRTHFHLPLDWEGDGEVQTTREETLTLCRVIAERMRAGDWDADVEVETYTWDVMPGNLRPQSLHRALAAEVLWANRALGG